MDQPKTPPRKKPHQHGHRARLRERFLQKGGEALPDYELLELLLFFSIPRVDVKALAKDLIDTFGSLAGVLQGDEAALSSHPQVGDATLAHLKALREAARRMALEDILEKPVIASWDLLIDYCRTAIAHKGEEEFHLLFLDRKNRLIADETQQKGTVDHTPSQAGACSQ